MNDDNVGRGLLLLFLLFVIAMLLIGEQKKEVTPTSCNQLCGLGKVESYKFNNESKHFECFCRKD